MDSHRTNCSAFTGLEAAIVLIAFITVASVFSYVVLGSGFLTTQKSQEVIYQSMGQVSSVMMITGNVYGISTSGSDIDAVNFTFRLSAGGYPIDFKTVTITYSNATELEKIQPVTGLSSSFTTPGTWAIIKKANERPPSNNVLESGEQFTISVHPSVGIIRNDKFTIDVVPYGGSATGIVRTVPAQIFPVTELY